MVYTMQWKETSEFLESSEFAIVEEVLDYLNQVSTYILRSDHRRRTQAPKIGWIEAPFSETERFPDDKHFLSFIMGTWRKELSRLQLAVQVMASPNRLSRDYPDYKTVGEAELYAIQSIAKIREAIRDDFISRERFESFFWLKWVD